MKQLLLKLVDASRGVIAFLRSVDIDQPRGVILCVTLQLVVVISLVLTFRTEAPTQPIERPIQEPALSEAIEPGQSGTNP
jgi:hypothetical protein